MAKKSKLAWKTSTNVAENARQVLPALARRYFKIGRKLLAGELSLDRLHPFRLETKRFRYTLEVFRPAYGPGLDRRLAGLREIQRHLGEINDCVATRGLLEERIARPSRQSAALFAFLDSQSAKGAAEFRKFWLETFDAPEQERLWCEYLSRFAGGRRKPVRR